ncbi:hypothetical protein [Citrobacter freundii]|uniref:hypothetical protein n=1 Tax=Citrobacter freundii TaxID=546 RepID=UPI001F3DFE50|nr:hypothetical protein [Citrobacter freundii]
MDNGSRSCWLECCCDRPISCCSTKPSASLDEHTEREFIQRLNQWLGNRTLIVATHRVPVLELVERVVV